MKIGVKFCGGCNPRYDRGEAFARIKERISDGAEFNIAKEGISFDMILVFGGCQNCCAAYEHYQAKSPPLLMWDITQEDVIVKSIKNKISNND